MDRVEMNSVVELAYRRYSKLRNEIERGFIKEEHIEAVSKSLFLDELTNDELSEMWYASQDFFDKLYCEFDENGKITGFKPYSEDTEFARDTKSAWSEVINQEARKRKERGEM